MTNNYSYFCLCNADYKTTTPATYDEVMKLMESSEVMGSCERLRQISSMSEEEQKYLKSNFDSVKKSLPKICWQAAGFEGNHRTVDNAYPNGCVMLDVDHAWANPAQARNWWYDFKKKDFGVMFPEQKKKSLEEWLKENYVEVVHFTESGVGLRVVGRLLKGESMQQGQKRLALLFGFNQWDSCTKDVSIISYLVAHSENCAAKNHLLYMKKEIFEEEITNQPEPIGWKNEYEEVINQLIEDLGRLPQEENRDFYYRLALLARYLVGNDYNAVVGILPDFGLTLMERMRTAQSACTKQLGGLPTQLLKAKLKAEALVEDENMNYSQYPEPELVKHIPSVFTILQKNMPDKFKAPLIVSMLPLMGALATGVTTRYIDGQQHHLNFMSIIVGRQASGKSFIRKPLELLMTPLKENDDIESSKLLEYKKQMEVCKNKAEQPENPHANIRVISFDSTKAGLLQALADGQNMHKFSFHEELGTLTLVNKTQYDKTTTYCAAFDNAEDGQLRKSAESFSGNVKIFYNWLATGTPVSLNNFLGTEAYTNGLATRLAVYMLPSQRGEQMLYFDDYTQLEAEKIINAAYKLYNAAGQINCPNISKSISSWIEAKRQLSIEMESDAIEILKNRAAVMGFRAGIIAHILWDYKHPQYAAEFAEYVAELIFSQQLKLFGHHIDQESEKEKSLFSTTKGLLSTKTLASLPSHFTREDAMKIWMTNNKLTNTKSAERRLQRWVKDAKIAKMHDGSYIKTDDPTCHLV